MRVVFLTLYPGQAASPRYRVHQFLPRLRALGWQCDVACAVAPEFWERYHAPEHRMRPRDYLFHERQTRRGQLANMDGYDAVFLQKALTTVYWRGMERKLEHVADRLLYDLDDAVHLAAPDQLARMFGWLEQPAQIRRIMAMAKATLAGNRWLQSEAQAAGGRATYFPTVVDTDSFTPAPQPDCAYRLGWIGSPSTAKYLAPIAEPVCESGAECLVVGAGDAPFEAEIAAWRLDEEAAQIARMSVGLMPLPDTDWARGKCGLKALLYMACGRPVIASPVEGVESPVVHGETGFLADTPDEWREAIEALRDPALRQRLGEAGRARVERHFSLDAWAPRMAELIEAAA